MVARRVTPPQLETAPLWGTIDPLEAELAATIVVAVELVSGLTVSVGIADGKFAAYVAAVLGPRPAGSGHAEAAAEAHRTPGPRDDGSVASLRMTLAELMSFDPQANSHDE